jgi:hypothetical protein
MNNVQLKLIAKFLDHYSEDLSNNSCNDYDVCKDGGLTEEEAASLKNQTELDGDEVLWDHDWSVVQFLRDSCLKRLDRQERLEYAWKLADDMILDHPFNKM